MDKMDKKEAIRLSEYLKTEYDFIRATYNKTPQITCLAKLHTVLLSKLGNDMGDYPCYKQKHFTQGTLYEGQVFSRLMGVAMGNEEGRDRVYERISVRGTFDAEEYLSLDYPLTLLNCALSPVAFLNVEKMKETEIPDLDGIISDDYFSLYIFEEDELLDENGLKELALSCRAILLYFISCLVDSPDERSGSYRISQYEDISVEQYLTAAFSKVREAFFPDISERDFLKIAPAVFDTLCNPSELNSVGTDDPAVMWVFQSVNLRRYLLWRKANAKTSSDVVRALDCAVDILTHPFRTEFTQGENVACLSDEIMGDDAYLFFLVSNDMDDLSANPCFYYAGMVFDTLYPELGI